MTINQQKEIINLSDTIKGEINRMCVTNDLFELNTMVSCATQNIARLQKLLYRAKYNNIKENKRNV